jgi:hypothetical protein
MTPAPWTLKQHATNHQTLTGATAGLIADIHKDEDARLLAAAPDLLELARQIELAAEQNEGSIPTDIVSGAIAVIAKATGEQA